MQIITAFPENTSTEKYLNKIIEYLILLFLLFTNYQEFFYLKS